MAIAFVQSATQVNFSAGTGSVAAITLNGVTAGNCIVVFASIYDNNNSWTITNTTDGGNTYTTRTCIQTAAPSNRAYGVVAYAVNVAGGNRTININLSGGTGSSLFYVIGAAEFSGVATSSAEDTWDPNDDIDTSGATDVSAGPITTTDAGDLLVGSAMVDTSDSNLNFSSPASWTNLYRQNNSFAYIGHDSGYWLPGSIQTNYTAQWSHDNNASDEGGGVIVALKPAAGGGPGSGADTFSLGANLVETSTNLISVSVQES